MEFLYAMAIRTGGKHMKWGGTWWYEFFFSGHPQKHLMKSLKEACEAQHLRSPTPAWAWEVTGGKSSWFICAVSWVFGELSWESWIWIYYWYLLIKFFCWPSHCRFRTAGCERVKVGFVEAASRMDLVLQAVEGFWSGLSKEIAETDANRIRSLPSQSSSWAATSCGDHGQVSKSHGDWWRRWKVADLGPGTVFFFSGSVLGWSSCHQRSILKHTEESIKALIVCPKKKSTSDFAYQSN